MQTTLKKKLEIPRRSAAGRRQVRFSRSDLVKTGLVQPGQTLPLLVEPAAGGLDLVRWAADHRDFIADSLAQHGGVLFRGFDVDGVDAFERFIQGACGAPLEYQERSSPRSSVSGHVYTSTDHPASQEIFLHNEQSYNVTWPGKILFFCVTAAEEGGETPLADCRKVFARLSPRIRELFQRRRYAYVRNFGHGLGLSWQETFQTEDRLQVEAYCKRNEIDFEWRPGGGLRTRQVRPAVGIHPVTGEEVWFNHATFFHVSTLDPSLRQGLLAGVAESELPNHTYYGDGSPIEPEVMDEIRRAYREETVTFPWAAGDLLLLDNMLVAHGRRPFKGPRKVVVGMADPRRHAQQAPPRGGPPRARKTIRIHREELVRSGCVEGLNGFPLMWQPSVAHLDLAAWARDHRDQIENQLLAHGAILFRGFNVKSSEDFEAAVRAVSPHVLDYRERAAPRLSMGRNVYTSTEFPSHQEIPLHHEMSYSHNWPIKIFFFCMTPPKERGRTPIVDDRAILPRLDPQVRSRFLADGVMYVRNYSTTFDLPWQEAFQTQEKSEVEAYCRQSGIDYEWRPGDGLRTQQVRQAVIRHPRTGDSVWFNHAHMFHVSNLDPVVRQTLLRELQEDELPRNAFYGDGSRIDDDVLGAVKRLYRSSAVAFTWQQGDVLLLDNVLASHGREPFVGPRQILVAMTDLLTADASPQG
jgi:alpha-ketoglutarate-dependent taurine dioxygenase